MFVDTARPGQSNGVWSHTGRLTVSRQIDTGELLSVTLPDDWQNLPDGGGGGGGTMTWRGTWSSAVAYVVNDGVTYNGSSYVAHVAVGPSATPPPSDSAHWAVLAQAGAQGPQGVPGPQGVQGETGATGSQGPQGVQGPIGPQGTPGVQGVKGDTGAQGIQGIQGPTGAPGADSTVPGPAGPQGATGAQGIQGIQGVKGDTGATGTQGPKGDTGATGTQGPAGSQGPAGPGVPVGGTTGQVLAKTSATDYATAWQTPVATQAAWDALIARVAALEAKTIPNSIEDLIYAG